MTDGPTDVKAIQDALDLLAKKLAGSEFRENFRRDPEVAAKEAGIQVGILPEGLLSTLGLMSDEELRFTARVQLYLKRSVDSSVAILF
jgi:hypothetical protein